MNTESSEVIPAFVTHKSFLLLHKALLQYRRQKKRASQALKIQYLILFQKNVFGTGNATFK